MFAALETNVRGLGTKLSKPWKLTFNDIVGGISRLQRLLKAAAEVLLAV
jgi:hypothetical protein